MEELITACRQLFETTRIEAPVVVDVGCGPFTGGFAITSILGHDTEVDYIGVDRSGTMRRFGEQLATAGESRHGMPRIRRPGVTVLNRESVKGQEFDAVFIMELEAFIPCTNDAASRTMYMMRALETTCFWCTALRI